MNKYIKYLIGIILVGVIGFLFYTKVYIPKSTFEIVEPVSGDLQISIDGIGNVSAKNIYSITPQTSGNVLQINADVGEWVKKGDLLVVMDGVDLAQQLEVAKATFEKSEFDVKASKNELSNQKSQEKLLRITYNRYAKLKDQKFASQSEYDKAKTDLDNIHASINASSARVSSAKSASKIALKNIDIVNTKIEKLSVYAPVDAYVIDKSVEVSQNISSTTPILKIVDAKTLWVEVKLDERISRSIEVGQSAIITLRSQSDKTYDGIVTRVHAMSDAVTLEREIDVAFVDIPNPFYINEQSEVKIKIKILKNIVKIPVKTVVQDSGKLGVWIVEDNHALFKEIEKVGQNDTFVAVKNFSKNLQIIVPSIKKKPLKNGMRIHL